MTKTPRARYTLESKQEAVLLVDNGQSIAALARTLRTARLKRYPVKRAGLLFHSDQGSQLEFDEGSLQKNKKNRTPSRVDLV